jgi:Flp pilus assembly protein TadG
LGADHCRPGSPHVVAHAFENHLPEPVAPVSSQSKRRCRRAVRPRRAGVLRLLFAIVETALMFLASQVLETITQDSARLILTGQAQTEQLPPALAAACPLTGTQTAAQFKCMVCQKIPALFNCNNIYVDVESYPSFAAININSQIDANGNFVNNMQYNPGGPGDIVVVRLFYQWPLFVTGLGYNISNMSGHQRLLVATAAFENEPYN